MGMFPPEINPDSKLLMFSHEADAGDFVYDLYNKMGALLGFSILLFKDRSMWLKVLAYPIFADCMFEVLDLIITNDEASDSYSLKLQNTVIIISLLYAIRKEINGSGQANTRSKT